MNPSADVKPMVIYHANCADGFGAAFSAWKKFKDTATYHPAHYGQPVPDIPQGTTHIYILDFSYPRDTLLKLAEDDRTVIVLDHHKTAQADLEYIDIPEGVKLSVQFDMARSGAMMAWDFFHGYQPPVMIRHIQDRDLWKFELPDTKAYSAALASYPMDFGIWSKIAAQDVAEYETFVESGHAILRMQDQQIAQTINSDLKKVVLLGSEGLGANVCNNISEVGNQIAKKSGTFSMTYWIKDQEVIVSLRSIAPYDVSVIAKHYGGGGHAQAAGFKMFVKQFFEEIWT